MEVQHYMNFSMLTIIPLAIYHWQDHRPYNISGKSHMQLTATHAARRNMSLPRETEGGGGALGEGGCFWSKVPS